jgi:hypothetical protein
LVYSNDDPFANVVLSLFNDRFDETPSSVRKSIERLGLSRTNLRGELATALLITRSGAEGINTQNVRQVHVIEPFWHRIRLEQVIGRARRAHSHDALPPKERFFDVFVYVATFTEAQKSIMRDKLKDDELTSDEFVQSVADRKHALLGQLQSLMQSVSVDCKRSCWRPKANDDAVSLYSADIRYDVNASYRH